MTHAAVGEIDLPPGIFAFAFGQVPSPGYVVGIHIQQACAGIEGWASLFCATVEPGEDHGVAVGAERHELARAAERAEMFQGPLVGFGRAARVPLLTSYHRDESPGRIRSGALPASGPATILPIDERPGRTN